MLIRPVSLSNQPPTFSSWPRIISQVVMMPLWRELITQPTETSRGIGCIVRARSGCCWFQKEREGVAGAWYIQSPDMSWREVPISSPLSSSSTCSHVHTNTRTLICAPLSLSLAQFLTRTQTPSLVLRPLGAYSNCCCPRYRLVRGDHADVSAYARRI